MVASEQHLYQTIVQFEKTILLPTRLATGSIPHGYKAITLAHLLTEIHVEEWRDFSGIEVGKWKGLAEI